MEGNKIAQNIFYDTKLVQAIFEDSAVTISLGGRSISYH